MSREAVRTGSSRTSGQRGVGRAWLPFLVSLVAVLGLWELVVTWRLVLPIVLPPPSLIAVELWARLVSIVTGGETWMHLSTTLSELVVGFALASVLGTGIGILISEVRVIRRAVFPYVIGLNAAPSVAFAPLFVLWLGFGIWSKVALVLTIATFPIIINTIAGLQAADPDSLKLMQSLGSTRLQTFMKVRVPYALPYLFAGIEVGIVLSVVGAIVAEFTSGARGLGFVLVVDQEHLKTADAFAIIIILSLIGVTLHRLVLIARGRFVFWHTR